MEDYFREIKLRVASLMMDVKRSWENTYKDKEPDDFEKRYMRFSLMKKKRRFKGPFPTARN